MRRLAPIVLAVVLAACGSTAQQRGAVTTNDGGLVASDASTQTTVAGVDSSGAPAGPSDTPTAGGTGDSTSDGASTGSASAPVASAAPGAKRTTGPIKIGFLDTVVGNAQALGVNTGETYSQHDVIEALVGAINKDGGLAGRQIVPVHAQTDTASSNWEASYAAACETFTHDNRVDAVLGYSFVLLESFEGCLADAGIPHVNAGYNLGDDTTFQTFPLLVGTTATTADRRYVLQLEGAVKAGVLTKANKVGLMLDDCPYDVRADKRSTQPYIEKAGIDVVASATMSCAQGAGDAASIAGQIQNAVLQFRSRGVDSVVIEGVPIVIFAETAESQGWHPRYLLTSGGAAIEPNVPAAQAANMYGFGVFPPLDVNPSHQPPRTKPQERCLGLLARSGMVPKQYNDFVNAYVTCDALFLYESALGATGGSSDGPTVVRAITSLGGRYQGVAAIEARTFFSPQRRDAPAVYRQWGWVADCSCFQYKGAAIPF